MARIGRSRADLTTQSGGTCLVRGDGTEVTRFPRVARAGALVGPRRDLFALGWDNRIVVIRPSDGGILCELALPGLVSLWHGSTRIGFVH